MVKLQKSKEIVCPKAFLDKEIPIKKGDFVTTNDGCSIKIYAVKEVSERMTTMYSVELTELEDDISIHLYYAFTEDLIFIDDSFVNVNGILWNIRQKILDGQTNKIKIN